MSLHFPTILLSVIFSEGFKPSQYTTTQELAQTWTLDTREDNEGEYDNIIYMYENIKIKFMT